MKFYPFFSYSHLGYLAMNNWNYVTGWIYNAIASQNQHNFQFCYSNWGRQSDASNNSIWRSGSALEEWLKRLSRLTRGRGAISIAWSCLFSANSHNIGFKNHSWSALTFYKSHHLSVYSANQLASMQINRPPLGIDQIDQWPVIDL